MMRLRNLLLVTLVLAARGIVVSDDECESEEGVCNDADNCTSSLGGTSYTTVTEASYSPPKKNYTSPAPKSTVGLGSDLGEIQHLDATYSNQIFERIEGARDYIQNSVMAEERFENVRHLCKNKHASCAFWSVLGECTNNPGYMHVNCAPVCNSCEMLHVDTRCPMDPEAHDALEPGGLKTLFQRISTDPEFQQYEPKVLSSPPGPWMVMFENILSDEESKRLIELGSEVGYERSSDVGERQEDGTYTKNINNGRTSTNAWCVEDCYEDPTAKLVMQRIENITGIPEVNSENLQLLRYGENQFYQRHNDYIPHQIDRQCGVRILTFYMYLNDVEEGGGTNFPVLGKTVTPKRGRAVLWPSVLDHNPNQVDPRTDHQAMRVTKGVKYGANAWIHQRDFKSANARGCS